MITFPNTIKLIGLVWLSNTLLEYCRADNSNLNCIIAPKPGRNVTGIEPRNFSLVNKCAKGYDNKDIIERCEVLINRKDPYDYKLTYPVISNITNQAYWNEYCATCNNDTAPRFFLSFFSWKTYRENELDTCDKLSQRIQRSEVDDIYNLSQIFISDGVKLIAERFDNTQLECSLNGKWPMHLLSSVIPCLWNDLYTGIYTRLQKCQYAEKTGKICTRMLLYKDGFPFYFQNYKEIPINVTLFEYDFAPGQYYQETEYPGVYYVCDIPGTIYGGNHSVKISIVVISVVCIIIILGMNSNKPYFQQNNTNKLLYFYTVGLIPMSILLLLIYLSHPVPCVAYYLAKFLWAYHFFWSMLLFIELCLKALGALRDRISSIRYPVYFIFGFVIPFVMPIIYYFGVLIVNENYKEDFSQLPTQTPYGFEYTCPTIPDHLGVFCTTSRNFGSKYYEDWLKVFLSPSFYFFIPALFIVTVITLSCYFLNNSSDEYAEPIPYRGEFIILTKMALIMGIHWGLFLIYQNYGSDHLSGILGVTFDTFCQLSVDFHGVIVFVVFGAETCVGYIMKMFGCEYKSVAQQDRNNDMEIS